MLTSDLHTNEHIHMHTHAPHIPQALQPYHTIPPYLIIPHTLYIPHASHTHTHTLPEKGSGTLLTEETVQEALLGSAAASATMSS